MSRFRSTLPILLTLTLALTACRDNSQTPVPTTPPPSQAIVATAEQVDQAKRKALVDSLSSQTGPMLVPVEKFFDGNNDTGSIGCNLIPHPGIDVFRTTLTDLQKRDDVEAVYLQISELDPGAGFWPFADTALVIGTIAPNDLTKLLAPLKPDEVGPVEGVVISPGLIKKNKGKILVAWWD